MSPAGVSVIVPVKDGERYLEELLAALAGQGGDELEILVIDSGSRDRSPEIARAAGGVELLEIAAGDFGHGRTRNLGAERTSGELICFLTQDATPQPGWLAAYREAFALADGVGAAYGPHLPRPDTSPMIARELVEFFATFGSEPAVQRAGDASFLSNVNACYARACWAEIGFRDVPYSEDQAFGADLLAAGWAKVYHPDAAVLHAHDYPPTRFMRRYFDEYRGLREAIGHIEPIGLRSGARDVRRLVGGDVRWMTERGYAPADRARWGGRSVVHHGGRKVFSALGSRAAMLPPGLQRRLSLEGRVAARPPDRPQAAVAPPRPVVPIPRLRAGHEYDPIARLLRDGPARLRDPVAGMAARDCLHLAFVIPPFGIGSGGHNIVFQLVHQLEQRGHTCSIWVFDPFEERANEWPAVMRRTIVENFAAVRAPLHKGFDHWRGADVVVATGWQTVYAALGLAGVRARAYLINDHEPEFYATSVESRWAELTYRMGLYGICGSPWLRDLYAMRYGGVGGAFQYGVDHTVYRPLGLARRTDTVVFYARPATGRRAVALGLLALAELHARRPDVRIVMFGETHPMAAPFPYDHLGVASPERLAELFNEATVGLCLSMTNYSLIPQEMLACGLPCVDLLGASAESVFGRDGPVTLAPFDADALAGALERLLGDDELRRHRADQGAAFVAENSWAAAAGEVERQLRTALRLREDGRELPAPALEDAGRRWRGGAERLGPGDLERALPPVTVGSEPVSDRLLERLTDADLAAVTAALTPGERAMWDAWPPERRQLLTLAYGVHHGVEGMLERTGLSAAMPPEEVHAMARDALAAGGGYWYADLVAVALSGAGADLWAVRDGLDFGASSGRVVRVLAAAHPEATWSGCDPNASAIGWARANLPGIDFFVSPEDPPVDRPDGAFDLVFAISVWSHYDRGAAVRWLKEMARIVRPGGHLLITTHGPESVAYHAARDTREPDQLRDIVRTLHREGFWFAPEFGPDGDWGVVHPEWGTAFLTSEWLLTHLGGDWHVAHFMPGCVEGNQDVYVLRRTGRRS
jgi:glycosyltransferase involved in cell wall biosynthesis/SAM-dependent methyltransferase